MRLLARSRSVLLAGSLSLGMAWAQGPRPDGPPPADRPGLARTALAIIEYTRWPGPPRPLNLCLATAGPFGRLLADTVAIENPQRLLPRAVAINAAPPPDCDVLVLAGWQEAALRNVMTLLDGRPVLTIGLGLMSCEHGAQFCLALNGPGARFAANADVLARSGLTVNPRVLQLAKPRLSESRT